MAVAQESRTLNQRRSRGGAGLLGIQPRILFKISSNFVLYPLSLPDAVYAKFLPYVVLPNLKKTITSDHFCLFLDGRSERKKVILNSGCVLVSE